MSFSFYVSRNRIRLCHFLATAVLFTAPYSVHAEKSRLCGILLKRQTAVAQYFEIDPVVRAWIEKRVAPKGLSIPTLNIDDQVRVGPVTATILHYLGKGAEGAVYLAQTPAGLVVVKKFFDSPRFIQGIEAIRRYRRVLPKVLAQDPVNNIVMMEYREGIPVSSVLGYDRNSYGWLQRSLIFARWLGWRAHSNSMQILGLRPSIWDANVIYSFRNKTFYFVDAF